MALIILPSLLSKRPWARIRARCEASFFIVFSKSIRCCSVRGRTYLTLIDLDIGCTSVLCWSYRENIIPKNFWSGTYHESDLDPEEHYTDTHGYVELNFAAFPMFGKRFCPRIRGLHRQWIYRIEPQRNYGPLTALLRPSKRSLHLDWITAHWDQKI